MNIWIFVAVGMIVFGTFGGILRGDGEAVARATIGGGGALIVVLIVSGIIKLIKYTFSKTNISSTIHDEGLQNLAQEQGNPTDQYNLGVIHYNGQGVPQDYKTAIKWYTLAAKQGHATAQYNIGLMYNKGRGVPKDDKTAVKWYRLAAKQGYADAQVNLGVMYDNGQGVTQDYKAAVKWFRLAAEQGHAKAQYNLGLMYNKGRGVPQYDKTAEKWFRLAAEQGHANAQNNLGVMYDLGNGVTQDDKTAVKWYRHAADQGHADAQFNLGEMYRNGHGVTQDDKTAVKWFRLAADQGHANAQYNLGGMYAYGHGVTQDDKTAVKWFRLAADQGDADAQYNLGGMYESGWADIEEGHSVSEGETKDSSDPLIECKQGKETKTEPEMSKVELARHVISNGLVDSYQAAHLFLTDALDAGDKSAATDLGYMSAKGLLGVVDFKEAMRLYGIGANGGDYRSAFNIGAMFLTGQGCNIDYEKALEWMQTSQALGNDGEAVKGNIKHLSLALEIFEEDAMIAKTVGRQYTPHLKNKASAEACLRDLEELVRKNPKLTDAFVMKISGIGTSARIAHDMHDALTIMRNLAFHTGIPFEDILIEFASDNTARIKHHIAKI
ncbi:MAG: hypothetical protein V7703_08215 [Hyphomicrobiales bacterium]